MAIFESLLGAGASILGGLFGKSSADKANEINQRNAEENLKFQREAAQSGIQWRVADAKAAGIAPLAALGAQTFNPSPVSVGAVADNSFGAGIASAGQNIGRAIDATRSSGDKVDAFTKATRDLTLQRMGLENEILASNLRTTMQAGRTPPMPLAGGTPQTIDGQSSTNRVTVGGYPVADDPIKQQFDTIPATAIIRPAGVPLKTNPYTTDAQDLEDRYGDVIEEVGGVANMGADGLYTLWQMYKDKPWVRSLFRDTRTKMDRYRRVRGPR